MKKGIIVLFAIINVMSCKSQHKSNMDAIINDITSQMTTYKEQPSYYANINSSACSFEFLINDMPVLNYYSDGGAGVSIPINPQILKSGQQTFKLRVYPGYYKKDKKLIQTTSLTKDTKFNLTFNVKDWSLKKDAKIFQEFSLPSTKNKYDIKEFSLAGTPYFEYEGTFKAEVPYSLKGWTESVNLADEDEEALQKEVVATYTELINKYKNKDIEGITYYNKNKAIEKLQTIYSTKKSEVSEAVYSYSKKFDNPSFHMKPLENYKMYFFGNGKTVCLLRTDIKHKGTGVVRAGFTNDAGKKRLSFLGYFFHRPSEGAPLEPIR